MIVDPQILFSIHAVYLLIHEKWAIGIIKDKRYILHKSYIQKSKHLMGYLFLCDITYKLNQVIKIICSKRFYRFNVKIAFHEISCQLLDMLEQSNIDISTWYNVILV